MSNGQFSMLEKCVKKDKATYKKGELVIARFVKVVKGRGVTVQVGDNIYAFVEISEITDEITGNVFKHLQKKMIFIARVIDHDKNGKM
jgi:translation initiation factor 2 alpha subunit (eIF-2alpha)